MDDEIGSVGQTGGINAHTVNITHMPHQRRPWWRSWWTGLVGLAGIVVAAYAVIDHSAGRSPATTPVAVVVPATPTTTGSVADSPVSLPETPSVATASPQTMGSDRPKVTHRPKKSPISPQPSQSIPEVVGAEITSPTQISSSGGGTGAEIDVRAQPGQKRNWCACHSGWFHPRTSAESKSEWPRNRVEGSG